MVQNQPPCPITSLFLVDQDYSKTVYIDPALLEDFVIPFPRLGWKNTYSDIECLVEETMYTCNECAQNDVTLDTESKAVRIKPAYREVDQFTLTLDATWPNGVSAPRQSLLVKIEPG